MNDWTTIGKVAFLVITTYDGKYCHLPCFSLDYYKDYPYWIERLIQNALKRGETVVIKDYGYFFPVPPFYNVISHPHVGEQLSLEL